MQKDRKRGERTLRPERRVSGFRREYVLQENRSAIPRKAAGDIQDNGILAFQVSGKNEGEYGKIVADTINISTNGTKLNLTLDNGALDNGETKTFTILDSSNITGSFAELSKNSRYEFIDNKDGTFDITSVASASNVAIDTGAVEHAEVANAWLDSDKNSITGQAKEIADHLNILSQNNPEKFVEALKALAPSITPITHSEMQSQNQQLFNLVSSRMTSSNIGLSGGDTFKNVGLWVQGLYNKTKYDVEDGFDYSSGNNPHFLTVEELKEMNDLL